MLATALSFLIITKIGRKPLILSGNILLTIICFIVGGIFYNIYLTNNNYLIIIPLIFICIFMLIYGMTIGPIIWLYVP